jgi:hypothetical protein
MKIPKVKQQIGVIRHRKRFVRTSVPAEGIADP